MLPAFVELLPQLVFFFFFFSFAFCWSSEQLVSS